MSISHEVTVWCDGEECEAFVQYSGTATDLRAGLRRSGWSCRGGVDLCPACKLEVQRDT